MFRWEDVPTDVENWAVLVIDTLRATTTLVTIIDRGGDQVLTCPSVDEAFGYKRKNPSLILGGERNNQPLPGFDAGNSPFDYPPAKIKGRSVVLTTTNGTQAINSVKAARWVGLAALTNARAAALCQRDQNLPGLVVCAGTVGQVAWEDVLTAGAIVALWPEEQWTDAARLAVAAYDAHRDTLQTGLLLSRHAQHLVAEGLGRDVEYASQRDLSSVVPVRQADGWFR